MYQTSTGKKPTVETVLPNLPMVWIVMRSVDNDLIWDEIHSRTGSTNSIRHCLQVQKFGLE
jgi:hypothetical protein